MTEKLPLVSVIVAVKNGERFIRESLQSVYDQNYPAIEVIVVDGRSTDNTLSIVNEFEHHKIIHQEEAGISDAYNIGIKAAKADYVSFISSDDIWMRDKLITQISYLMNHHEVMFTNSYIKYFLDSGSEIPYGFRKKLFDGVHPARIMENFVAKKKVFECVGYFKKDLSTAEDVDWFSRAHHLNIPSHVIPKVLLKKRIHNRNTSMNVLVNNKNLLKVLRSSVHRKSSMT